jgi:hypothetical protein
LNIDGASLHNFITGQAKRHINFRHSTLQTFYFEKANRGTIYFDSTKADTTGGEE